MPRLEGAYSTVVMTKRAIVAFRDPHGVRPLSLGRLDDRFVVASESCAFDIIGAELMREVHPGEMVSLTERGLETRQVVKAERPAMCVFEHIYFSRPDSRLEGKVLQQVRGRMGEILWREAPVEADLVISVPDSGNPAAAGFARASGLPRDDGLIKNRYVARTFIQPGQELRKHGLRLKFNPLPEIVSGQRIVVVDDSIVRGNTTRQIVGMLRDAGAREVHLRISAPPIRNPCHYGVDMSTREEMIAHKRTRAGDRRRARRRLARLPLARRRLRGDRHPARGPLRRLLQRPLPARRPRGGERQVRAGGRRRGPGVSSLRGKRGDDLGRRSHVVDARDRLARVERAGVEQGCRGRRRWGRAARAAGCSGRWARSDAGLDRGGHVAGAGTGEAVQGPVQGRPARVVSEPALGCRVGDDAVRRGPADAEQLGEDRLLGSQQAPPVLGMRAALLAEQEAGAGNGGGRSSLERLARRRPARRSRRRGAAGSRAAAPP